MKVSGTSAGTETCTPPMKKLKQARLPFQVITPESAKEQDSKKRKLSEEKDVAPNKLVKKSIAAEFKDDVKEKVGKNDEPLLISDEDEKIIQDDKEDEKASPKSLNPYVALVDVALKRKLLKKKSPPKKKFKESKTPNSEKSKKGIEKTVENTSEAKTEYCNDVENASKSIKKIDNKENINKIILIEDSNDVDTIASNKNAEIGDKKIIEVNSENIILDTTVQQSNDQEIGNDEKCEANKIDEFVSEDKVLPSEHESNSTAEPSKSDDQQDEEVKECDVSMSVDENPDISIQVSDSDESEKIDTSLVDISSQNSDDDDSNDVDLSMTEETSEKNTLITPSKKGATMNPMTPKSKKSGTSGTNSPHTPGDKHILTPKQLQKKLDSAKKQQEREKERLEKLRKKQEEKEERNKQRLEKEEQRRKEREEKENQKKREREEKEEQKRREKEEKDKMREQERREREEKEESKRKEREEKEMQKKREREAKEEERRKKEIEKEEDKRKKELEKEEAENKKKKAAAAFVNFFVPKASGSKQQSFESEPVIKHDYLSNFTKKVDMRLAPLHRKTLSDEQKFCLDEHLNKQVVDRSGTFICQWKDANYEIGSCGKTWPLEDEDVMVVEDELPIDSVDFVPEETRKQKMRAKLLSFSDNRRPPYWGTWRRKSKHITGRRPFGMDSNILDYECDSDDEWEEEEPGESVGGSVAGSDDEEEDNDYDIDNDFMVPHGYLSDEEAMCEEDEVLSPESQKAKLKIMQCEFEKEMKKNTEKLHPRSIGIIWQTTERGRPDSCKDSLWDFLFNKRILINEDQVIIQPKQVVSECTPEEIKSDKPVIKTRKITEDMTIDLIKLVHGNTNNRGFLAHEFQTYLAKLHKEQNENSEDNYINVSKMSIAKKIKEISKWMPCSYEGPMFGKMCWCVYSDVFEKYDFKVDLPNKWNYVLKEKKKKSNAPLPITQFLNTEQSNT